MINFHFIFEANISLFCIILLLIFDILSKITKGQVPNLSSFT